ITRNGKYVAPGVHLRGRPTTETTVTPGPSEYHFCSTSPRQHQQDIVPLTHTLPAAPPAGPGTYTLPRLMGPNTAYTLASPCYSVRGRSQRGRFDEDLAKTPGPAALPKVPVDAYKTRAPAYTMAARPRPGEGKAAKPGPADYSVGRVRQLLSSPPLFHMHSRHVPFP
uniref:Outer dense fiber of sperm tails 3 like 2 n=1 Tax=Phasianus colchicus TaxID=9054 RepID=A0A669R717_PHACC